jgi:hypothetical protein
VTFIDAPQIHRMHVTFFNQIDYECQRLAQFIDRTSTLRARNKAHVQFNDLSTGVVLLPLLAHHSNLEIKISCRIPQLQLLSVARVCNSLHPLFTVEDLYIQHRYWGFVWKEYAMENTLWLELLLPFTAVKNLYLSKEFAPGIAAALQELVGSRITEVLPSLQSIAVEGITPGPLGPSQKCFEQFVTARQLSGHDVAIWASNKHVWN